MFGTLSVIVIVSTYHNTASWIYFYTITFGSLRYESATTISHSSFFCIDKNMPQPLSIAFFFLFCVCKLKLLKHESCTKMFKTVTKTKKQTICVKKAKIFGSFNLSLPRVIASNIIASMDSTKCSDYWRHNDWKRCKYLV